MSKIVEEVLGIIKNITDKDITDGKKFSNWLEGEIEELKEFLRRPAPLQR